VSNQINLPVDAEAVTGTGDDSAVNGTNANTTDNISIREKQRKDDVRAILDALKEYKIDNGSYPLSSSILKLNAKSNIIEQALVPTYLSVLPHDPKDSEGWYYGYKSDGNKCSVSARMEDTADLEGQLIGDVYLYLKYNNN
jgi:hypothetical protein